MTWWRKRRPPDPVHPHGYGRDFCPFCEVVATWQPRVEDWRPWKPTTPSCRGNAHGPWGRCRGLERPHVHRKCRVCGNEWLTEPALAKEEMP